ncbi:MAG: substrate-binding domain-containing protein [Caldimonas sp.]
MAIVAGLIGPPAAAQSTTPRVAVFAAGSLRAALVDAGRAFESAQPGAPIAFTFGASGLLKDRLAAGENADVFASANRDGLDHPSRYQTARAGPAASSAVKLYRAGPG